MTTGREQSASAPVTLARRRRPVGDVPCDGPSTGPPSHRRRRSRVRRRQSTRPVTTFSQRRSRTSHRWRPTTTRLITTRTGCRPASDCRSGRTASMARAATAASSRTAGPGGGQQHQTPQQIPGPHRGAAITTSSRARPSRAHQLVPAHGGQQPQDPDHGEPRPPCPGPRHHRRSADRDADAPGTWKTATPSETDGVEQDVQLGRDVERRRAQPDNPKPRPGSPPTRPPRDAHRLRQHSSSAGPWSPAPGTGPRPGTPWPRRPGASPWWPEPAGRRPRPAGR